ncbi:MAG: sugar transferase [Syntrophobacteraceae bacterium]
MNGISKETAPSPLTHPRRTDSAFLDGACYIAEDSTFLKEEYFHHLLGVERKRTERSGNPSLLMLIDLHSLSVGQGSPEMVCRINSLLSSILRESDILGWYTSYSVVGAILSEIGDSNSVEAMEMILAKFKKSMAAEFGPELAEGIRTDFEYITKKKKWKNSNSLLKLSTSDKKTAEPEKNGFVSLLKSLLRGQGFLAFIDLMLVTIAQFAGFLFAGDSPAQAVAAHLEAYLLAALTCWLLFYIFGLYDVESLLRTREVPLRIFLSVIPALIVSAGVCYSHPSLGYVKGMLAIQAGGALVLLTCWRLSYGRVFHFSQNRLPTLIIGAGERGTSALKLLSSSYSQFEVAGFLDDDPARIGPSGNGTPPILGSTNNMREIISEKGIKAVVLAMASNGSGNLTRSMLEARLCGLEVYDLPSLYEKVATRIPVEHVEDRWLVFADGFNLISRQYVQTLKRIFDFIFAGLLIAFFLPFALLTALAIRIDSPGPVFFKQVRIGRGGKPFTLYKFRSMCTNAEAQGAKWAEANDPRVTRVGRVIRTLRIDELPQIWNVFLGEMSLIGPRPERPEFVEDLDRQIPYYGVRHTVRPGITGWAQIKYPYGANVEDALRKLEYDLFYIKNMSVLQDMKILLQTIGVVILGKGAR